MKRIEYNENKNIISSSLRQARAKCGITQGQLAARIQVLGGTLDQQMISKIERNTRIVTDFEVVLLAHALHMHPVDLLEEFYNDCKKDWA